MNIRKEIQKALQTNDYSIIEACFSESAATTSRTLQMHVYGMPHEITRWRAIEFIGKLAGAHAEEQDDLFRNIIRRFLWQMCEESANVPWASAEVIGSIVANVPGKRFDEFLGPWFFHSDLNEICFAGLFWTLPEMMHYHADRVQEFLPSTMTWFERYDEAELRAYAAIYYKDYPLEEMRDYLQAWAKDTREATVYKNDNVSHIAVSKLANEALAALDE